jgi:hypothetical protein
LCVTLAIKELNWKELLDEISLTINTRIEDNMIYYDKTTVKDNWLGFNAADKDTLYKKERELGISFPPSYREFLLTTNGFRQISLFSGDLKPIDKIDWVKNTDPDFLKIFNDYNDIPVPDDKYFIYGEGQRSEVFRVDYLNETLQISEWVDGAVILLNPKVKFGEEWEAWIYANWYPGAHRYKSFEELVKKEFYSTVVLLNSES